MDTLKHIKHRDIAPRGIFHWAAQDLIEKDKYCYMARSCRLVVRQTAEESNINKIKQTMEMEEKYQDTIIKLMCDINHCNLIVNDRVKSDSEKIELLKTYIKATLEYGIDYLPEEEE